MSKQWQGARGEIAKYCRDNDIKKTFIRLLGITQWQNVYEKVLECFVDHSYSNLNGLHWANTNNGFRSDVDMVFAFREGLPNTASYDWLERLPEIVGEQMVYLLVEESLENYFICECVSSAVHLVINEAIYPSDYYITDKKFNWLISENHHDVVLFLGKGFDEEKIRSVCLKCDQEEFF